MIRWLWSRIMKWGWDFGREKQMEVVDLATSSSSRGGDPIVLYRGWETDRKSTRLNSSHRL